MGSRTFDLRLTCPVSAADTLTCWALHVSCMVAPLSSAVLYRRSCFVQFFSTKVERHRAPFCGTHNFCVILPYGADANCVAPRAVHQMEYQTAQTGDVFCCWGLSSVV